MAFQVVAPLCNDLQTRPTSIMQWQNMPMCSHTQHSSFGHHSLHKGASSRTALRNTVVKFVHHLGKPFCCARARFNDFFFHSIATLVNREL